jgi:hypothetical protein
LIKDVRKEGWVLVLKVNGVSTPQIPRIRLIFGITHPSMIKIKLQQKISYSKIVVIYFGKTNPMIKVLLNLARYHENY